MAKKASSNYDKLRPTKSRSASHPRQIAWWGKNDIISNDVLKGVQDYLASHQAWNLYQVWDIPEAKWSTWTGDGILVCGHHQVVAPLVERMRMPVVAILTDRSNPSLLRLETDDAAVGVMAAEHLLNLGLRHFGFCGSDGNAFSCRRRDAFVRRIQQNGFSCEVYTALQPSGLPQTERISDWLTALPKPVGVMGDPEVRGREILAACRRRKLSVPEEIAVITVNDGGDRVQLESPPLSGVRQNIHRMGFEAAAWLDRLISGEKKPAETLRLIAPQCVETRQSTDMLAIPNPQVTAVLRYIRQHACEGIQIKDVLREMPQSRQKMEQDFLRFVGRTPHDEIIRVRMNLTKELLAGTNLPLKKIAERTGFVGAAYLTTAFQRLAGMTPGKYRSLHGSGSNPAHA